MPPALLAQRLEHPRADGSSAPLCSPSPANGLCPPQCPPWPSHRHRGAAQPGQAWGSWAGGGGRTAAALSLAWSLISFTGTPQPFQTALHVQGDRSSLRAGAATCQAQAQLYYSCRQEGQERCHWSRQVLETQVEGCVHGKQVSKEDFSGIVLFQAEDQHPKTCVKGRRSVEDACARTDFLWPQTSEQLPATPA